MRSQSGVNEIIYKFTCGVNEIISIMLDLLTMIRCKPYYTFTPCSRMTTTITKSNSNPIIYINNDLMDAIIHMDLPEHRVLWLAWRSYRINEGKFAQNQLISHRDYANHFGVSLPQATRDIQSACNSFPDNSFFQFKPEWDRHLILDEMDCRHMTNEDVASFKGFKKGNIVSSCEFGIKRGVSQINFTKEFLTLALPKLGDFYTQYRFLKAKKLNNEDHIALYHELKRWQAKGEYITNPVRLFNKLRLPDTYSKYSQMKRGFLIPALNKINEITDLDVNFDRDVQEIKASEKKNAKVIGLTIKLRAKDLDDFPTPDTEE